MATKKNLTLGAIKNDNKRFDERYEVTVNGYTLTIEREWRATKINEMINEIMETYEATKMQKQSILEIFSPYVVLLMIKHFTSLKIPNKLDEQLKVLDWLVDGDYLTPIYEYLPKDQVDKTFTEIGKMTNRLNENIDGLKEEIAKTKLENPELFALEEEEIEE